MVLPTFDNINFDEACFDIECAGVSNIPNRITVTSSEMNTSVVTSLERNKSTVTSSESNESAVSSSE